MRAHRNLYKFSQQGWESLNEKVKLSFFNHTQRGGNFGQHRAGKILLKISLYVFPEGASLDVRNSRSTIPKCTIRKSIKLILSFTLNNFVLILSLHLDLYKIHSMFRPL
jgi:hypothetical protein